MARMIELTENECLALLADEVVGRVGLSTPVGPRIVPVNYTLTGREVVFRTTPYSELGTYGRHTEAAFEVDQIDTRSRCGCSVVAIGPLEPIEDYDELRTLQTQADPRPWADGRRHLYLRLRIRELTGRRIMPSPAVA